jgi:hypothetical protein
MIRGSATPFLRKENTIHIFFFFFSLISALSLLFWQQPIVHSAKILNMFGFSMISKKIVLKKEEQ